jgi:hypothetical protein
MVACMYLRSSKVIMKKLFFITACLFTLFFTSCTKEMSDNFITYPNSPLNDTVWVRNVAGTASVHDLFDLLAPGMITDSFSVASGASLHYGDSLALEFQPNSCVGSGSMGIPPGLVKLEIVSLKRKGDFIKFFKPTTTENGSILVSGGGLFIRVTKEGKELSLVQGSTVKVKFSDIDTAKLNMQAFYGRESSPVLLKGIDTSFSWVRDLDTTWLRTWTSLSTNPLVSSYYGYEMNSKNLRWIAAERYVDSTLPKTKVTAILSPNFTNKNTAVFAVFANQKTVVNMRGDFPSRSFFANNIPLGIAVTLVSVSKIGDDLYLGVENISKVATVTHHTLKPEKKSLKDILGYLNSL